ncbi:MAG: cytochrome c oxidase subunit 3 [Phycisphaerae bacterium]|nr:cytochrome c oxidase subunit 3 [Phycisphaerae bacterium]
MFPLGLLSTGAFGRDWFEPEFGAGDRRARDPRQLGMRVFIASLAMLFASSIVLHYLIRWQMGKDAPALPGAPPMTILATLVLLASGATMVAAQSAVRRNRLARLELALFATLALGCTFLLMQFFAWVDLTRRGIDLTTNLAAFAFYLLTVLHALHVVGGIIALTWTSLRARRRIYSASNIAGVELCAEYWHFLGLVWIVLAIVLFVVR